jgi:hypothetical protein
VPGTPILGFIAKGNAEVVSQHLVLVQRLNEV